MNARLEKELGKISTSVTENSSSIKLAMNTIRKNSMAVRKNSMIILELGKVVAPLRRLRRWLGTSSNRWQPATLNSKHDNCFRTFVVWSFSSGGALMIMMNFVTRSLIPTFWSQAPALFFTGIGHSSYKSIRYVVVEGLIWYSREIPISVVDLPPPAFRWPPTGEMGFLSHLSGGSASHPPLKWDTPHIWGVSHVHGGQRPVLLPDHQIFLLTIWIVSEPSVHYDILFIGPRSLWGPNYGLKSLQMSVLLFET